MSKEQELSIIPKTYKNYVGGAFPRTESGRYYKLNSVDGKHLANVCLSTRKDIRNAVQVARKAQASWQNRTAYNQGQIIYRIAEILSGRRHQFEAELESLGYSKEVTQMELKSAIDLIVYFAGWTDKVQQVFGAVNPVASHHFNFSRQEAMGVVGMLAPEAPALLGALAMLLPNMVAGNSSIIIASEKLALPLCTFAEVLETSDVPAGVVNILTGKKEELVGHFVSHMDLDALIADPTLSFELRKELEVGSTSNLKRLHFWATGCTVDEIHSTGKSVIENMAKSAKDPYRILDVQEVKTTWHPISE